MQRTKTKKQPKPQRVPEQITVTVSRTVQVTRFEPVTVTVTEVHNLNADDDARSVRRSVYRQIAGDVELMVAKEVERYKASLEEEDDDE